VIEAIDLVKDFGAVRAVDHVSFVVPRGEIAGFLGPNGAGKTTTMRLLCGVFAPSAGRARIAGFDTRSEPFEARRRLGYFAENAPHYPELRVRDYLGLVALLKDVPHVRRRAAIDLAIDRCGLAEATGRRIGTLSKGFRQRVGLAQALLGEPEVLILDEPTAGLDPEQAIEIRTLIRSLRSRCTVLLSSHALAEIGLVCGRIIVVRRGRILAEETPERLAERLGSQIVVRLRVDAPEPAVIAALGGVPGVLRMEPAAVAGTFEVHLRDDDAARETSRLLLERRWPVLEMTRRSVELEDVFLALVRDESPPRGGGS
jgi:ABC-2 type transport system ATP-binding protein